MKQIWLKRPSFSCAVRPKILDKTAPYMRKGRMPQDQLGSAPAVLLELAGDSANAAPAQRMLHLAE